MMPTPVSASPARIARWTGAAPRQRGSSEPWTLRQPCRGASSTGARQDQAVGGDHRHIGVERRERRLLLRVRAATPACAPRSPAPRPAAAPARATSSRPRRPPGRGGWRIGRDDLVPRRDQRVERRHREVGRSHEDDPHGALSDTLARRARNPLSVPHGIPRDRGADAGAGAAARARPALGAARGAAPAQEARGGARSAARRAGGGRGAAGDLRDLRQCRHHRPVRDLRRSAPRRARAVRGRGGGGPLGARSLAAVSRALPRARRAAVGAGGHPPRGSGDRHAGPPRRRRAGSTRSCWR